LLRWGLSSEIQAAEQTDEKLILGEIVVEGKTDIQPSTDTPFLTYHVNKYWDASGGVRYVSDSYSRLENTDDASNVYGYLFVDLKTSYQISKTGKIAFGIDNVTDKSAFVAHPWPQRTYYFEASIRI